MVKLYRERYVFIIFIVLSFCSLNNGFDSLFYRNYTYQIKTCQLPVDHFNNVNEKNFELRYLYNDSFANFNNIDSSPLFFYTGNEGDIELFAQNTGFLWELALQFKARIVFAEHRYYGKSLPFGLDTFNTTEYLGYLTVEQALEDFASLISLLTANKSAPVITFGGSYGGMLSAWIRMKYPHLVTGALAASAPIWQFHSLTPCDIFSSITTSVFATSLNSNCSLNIAKSWALFQNLSTTDSGKKQINDKFNFCTPIKEEKDLDAFFDFLEDVYGNLAMANYPYANSFIAPLPGYPVRQFCSYLKEEYEDINLIISLQQAVSVYTNFTGTLKCLNYSSAYDDSLGGIAWDIQTCNQLVLPMCSYSNTSMFRNKDWNFEKYSNKCYEKHKLRPKLNEMIFRYGGKNLRSISNIIFSNGLLDPWSGGGVLQNINKEIDVIIIPDGAHHLDLRESTDQDPGSVKQARLREKKIISNWIENFYYDLKK